MRLMPTAMALLAGCADGSPTPPQPESEQAGETIYRAGEAPDEIEAHLVRMKSVIRQDLRIAFDKRCEGITAPDDAFLPIEITGGGLPELALSMGLVECKIGPSVFSGTGGVNVQFWIGNGGPVRLLLEQQMHGFTPGDGYVQAVQHGATCPGGAGPDSCIVTYRWNDKGRRLEVASMVLGSDAPIPPAMNYDIEDLTRRSR